MIPHGHLEHPYQANSRDQGPGRCHWCSLGPEFHVGPEAQKALRAIQKAEASQVPQERSEDREKPVQRPSLPTFDPWDRG